MNQQNTNNNNWLSFLTTPMMSIGSKLISDYSIGTLLALGSVVVLGGSIIISKYYLKLFDWLDFSFIFKQGKIIEKFHDGAFKEKTDTTNMDMSLFWYPVALSKEVSATDLKPKSITLFGEPLVLYRTSDGKINCVKDLCPHRSAKLSTGQITEFEGKRSLECAYHGWRFEKEGECVRIPSVASERMQGLCSTIKCQSKQVHECCGMIWIFPNENVKGNIDQIPLELFREEYLTEDSSKMDLLMENTRYVPCHYSFVLENLLDPAHLDFTHDGTIGKRSNATQIQSQLILSKDLQDDSKRNLIPKLMQYDQTIHQDSFIYRFTKPEFKSIPGLKSEFLAQISFVPPCFVRLDTHDYVGNQSSGPRMSQVFCLIPTGENQVKIIYKLYSSISILKHLNKIPFIRNKLAQSVDSIFDQDVELLSGVYENVKQNGAKIFSKIVSADAPIKAYRNWESTMLKANKNDIFFKGWDSKDIEDLF